MNFFIYFTLLGIIISTSGFTSGEESAAAKPGRPTAIKYAQETEWKFSKAQKGAPKSNQVIPYAKRNHITVLWKLRKPYEGLNPGTTLKLVYYVKETIGALSKETIITLPTGDQITLQDLITAKGKSMLAKVQEKKEYLSSKKVAFIDTVHKVPNDLASLWVLYKYKIDLRDIEKEAKEEDEKRRTDSKTLVELCQKYESLLKKVTKKNSYRGDKPDTVKEFTEEEAEERSEVLKLWEAAYADLQAFDGELQEKHQHFKVDCQSLREKNKTITKLASGAELKKYKMKVSAEDTFEEASKPEERKAKLAELDKIIESLKKFVKQEKSRLELVKEIIALKGKIEKIHEPLAEGTVSASFKTMKSPDKAEDRDGIIAGLASYLEELEEQYAEHEEQFEEDQREYQQLKTEIKEGKEKSTCTEKMTGPKVFKKDEHNAEKRKEVIAAARELLKEVQAGIKGKGEDVKYASSSEEEEEDLVL